ncbi:MAG: hypothetical protein QXM93_06180 [Candidatus Methanomethyliaceae archaeon]
MNKMDEKKIDSCGGDSKLRSLIRRITRECEWAERHSFPSC